MDRNDRLERAKQYLAIAESNDSKREAYKAAADEIVAHQTETGATKAAIGRALGKSAKAVEMLVKWQTTGFEAETPWLMDTKATTRASVSHTKKILTEQAVDEIEELLDDLPDEAVEKLAEATERTKVTRKLYPDKPKPSHRKASQKAKASDTAGLRRTSGGQRPARLGDRLGPRQRAGGRQAVRGVPRARGRQRAPRRRARPDRQPAG
jgi:hypothetical protein